MAIPHPVGCGAQVGGFVTAANGGQMQAAKLPADDAHYFSRAFKLVSGLLITSGVTFRPISNSRLPIM